MKNTVLTPEQLIERLKANVITVHNESPAGSIEINLHNRGHVLTGVFGQQFNSHLIQQGVVSITLAHDVDVVDRYQALLRFLSTRSGYTVKVRLDGEGERVTSPILMETATA
jgi:hypothetical protein